MNRQGKAGHHYGGLRDTKCQMCKKLFRASDITGGICVWCRWDTDVLFRMCYTSTNGSLVELPANKK